MEKTTTFSLTRAFAHAEQEIRHRFATPRGFKCEPAQLIWILLHAGKALAQQGMQVNQAFFDLC